MAQPLGLRGCTKIPLKKLGTLLFESMLEVGFKFRNIILKIIGVFLTLVYTVMGTGIFVTSVVTGPIGRMVDFIGSIGG